MTLRELAEKATPGPWHLGEADSEGNYPDLMAGNECLADFCQTPTAAYIAACSPERIIALLDCVEAAKVWWHDPENDAAYDDVGDAVRALEAME